MTTIIHQDDIIATADNLYTMEELVKKNGCKIKKRYRHLTGQLIDTYEGVAIRYTTALGYSFVAPESEPFVLGDDVAMNKTANIQKLSPDELDEIRHYLLDFVQDENLLVTYEEGEAEIIRQTLIQQFGVLSKLEYVLKDGEIEEFHIEIINKKIYQRFVVNGDYPQNTDVSQFNYDKIVKAELLTEPQKFYVVENDIIVNGFVL